MYYKDKEVYTSSRGGKDYDTPTTYIRKNTFLNQFKEISRFLIEIKNSLCESTVQIKNSRTRKND